MNEYSSVQILKMCNNMTPFSSHETEIELAYVGVVKGLSKNLGRISEVSILFFEKILKSQESQFFPKSVSKSHKENCYSRHLTVECTIPHLYKLQLNIAMYVAYFECLHSNMCFFWI